MISVVRWNKNERSCHRLTGQECLGQCDELRSTSEPMWIDLEAATDEEIKCVFEQLQPVHTLTLEDITRQRRDPEGRPHLPKVEEFPDYLFIIVNPLTLNDWPEGDFESPMTTQLAAILTHSRLITYHEGSVPAVRELHGYLERHEDQGRRGPDYLFHLILDAMVDEYAPLLDTLTDRLDELEESVFHGKTSNALPQMLHLKRRLTIVRKTLTYEREVLARMARGEFELIDERETVYYRNVYDHLVRFTELTEGSREMVADLLQTHLSVVSNRLNEVMKALTMVSTVVLPMSVVTGIYGMNFPNFWPLNETWGPWFATAFIIACGLIPIAWFRWKKWL